MRPSNIVLCTYLLDLVYVSTELRYLFKRERERGSEREGEREREKEGERKRKRETGLKREKDGERERN